MKYLDFQICITKYSFSEKEKYPLINIKQPLQSKPDVKESNFKCPKVVQLLTISWPLTLKV